MQLAAHCFSLFPLPSSLFIYSRTVAGGREMSWKSLRNTFCVDADILILFAQQTQIYFAMSFFVHKKIFSVYSKIRRSREENSIHNS